MNGTTDVTRTLHLGEPTEEQKEAYTLVLKVGLSLESRCREIRTEGIGDSQTDIEGQETKSDARRDPGVLYHYVCLTTCISASIPCSLCVSSLVSIPFCLSVFPFLCPCPLVSVSLPLRAFPSVSVACVPCLFISSYFCCAVDAKGMIGLSDQKFPEGCKGPQIDVLARQHLWRRGLDYLHGRQTDGARQRHTQRETETQRERGRGRGTDMYRERDSSGEVYRVTYREQDRIRDT